jgi:periplasmic protein TonB
VFDTLLASNVATRPRVRSGLIALFLHIAVVLGAISATAMSGAIFQPAARDTIRLDLTRPRMLEPQRSSPAAPPSGAPEIPAPPPVIGAPPQIPALEPLRFSGSPMDVRAFAGMLQPPDSGRPAGSPGPASGVSTVTEVDVLPQLTSHLQPHYPEALRRAGVSGQVLLEYIIGSNGWVDSSSVRVLLTSHPEFTDAAREALRSVQFRPGRRSGQPVAVLVRQTIRFEIR